MRFLLAVLILFSLIPFAIADTTPGTIVTTSASVTYADISGQQMPQQTSNQADVLIIAKNPTPTVYLTLKSLYFGPKTVGRAIKLAGKITRDQNGVYWLEDGSVKTSTGGSANKLYCKISPTFLTPGTLSQQTSTTVVTGISQVETDGTPIIVPEADTSLQPLTP